MAMHFFITKYMRDTRKSLAVALVFSVCEFCHFIAALCVTSWRRFSYLVCCYKRAIVKKVSAQGHCKFCIVFYSSKKDGRWTKATACWLKEKLEKSFRCIVKLLLHHPYHGRCLMPCKPCEQKSKYITLSVLLHDQNWLSHVDLLEIELVILQSYGLLWVFIFRQKLQCLSPFYTCGSPKTRQECSFRN